MIDIVFFGLGNMGGLMVVNLFKVGYWVNVFDLQFKVVLGLVEQGVQGVDSVLQCCEGVEVVISMLLVGQYVESLYFGDDGLFVWVVGKFLLIDCLIIVLEIVCKVVEVVVVKGLILFDVLVFGGVGGVCVGILSFIVGGFVEGFVWVWLIFENMGWNIFYVGDYGVGQVVKICNNMFFGIFMVGIVEVLVLGVKNGFDLVVLFEVMKQSFGGNWVLNFYNFWFGVMLQVLVSNGYVGGFQVCLMNKDFGLVLVNVQVVQVLMLFGVLVCNLFSLYVQVDVEYEGLDFFSIQKFYCGKD